MSNESVTRRTRGSRGARSEQTKGNTTYPASSVPEQPACVRNHSDPTAGSWPSWRKSGVPQCSQCQHKLDDLNPWLSLGDTQYGKETEVSLCAGSTGNAWTGWEYGTMADIGPPEHQQRLEVPSPTSDLQPRYLESHDQSNNSLQDWSQFVSNVDMEWMNVSPCEASIKTYALTADDGMLDEARSYIGNASNPMHTRSRPTHRSTTSSTTISTTVSSEMPVSQAESYASATMQEQDEEKPAIPLSEDIVPRPITPPHSLSPEQDLQTHAKKRKVSRDRLTRRSSSQAQKSRIHQMAGHSVCEKRYRTKLNDELATLRTKVPSLRVIPKRNEEYAYREGSEKLERPEATTKFDKATIVSKAIEYISYLEACNKRLSEEHLALKARVGAIQIAVSGLRRTE